MDKDRLQPPIVRLSCPHITYTLMGPIVQQENMMYRVLWQESDGTAHCRSVTMEEMVRLLEWRRQSTVRSSVRDAWIDQAREQRLYALAKEYAMRCEAYDRSVCSGYSNVHLTAMPMNPDEYRLVNTHARQVRQEILAQGRVNGFTEAEVIEAIGRWHDQHP